jgi:hypothetical protein
MQLAEITYRIGKLEAGLASAHTRAANQWELLMVIAREHRENGDGLKRKIMRWLRIAGYGLMALLSVLGITLPEKVAAFLKALMH